MAVIREIVEPKDDRRKQAEPAKMRSKKIDEVLEDKLLNVAGFTRADLYNRRGGLSERGLVALLESTDEICEVKADHVVISTADGSKQTFWNMKKDLPFIWSVKDNTKNNG